MKLRSIIAPLIVAGLTIAIAGSACGGEDTRQIEVSLAEFRIVTEVSEIEAGEVTLVVSNDGEKPHEFIIIKSDFSAGDLPVVEGKVPEDEVNLIDEIEPFAAGSTERLTVTLSAGKYILICNITEFPPDQPVESHYQEGMGVTFLVIE